MSNTTMRAVNNLKKPEVITGDFVEYYYSPERKTDGDEAKTTVKKGIIAQVTESLLIIQPEKPAYPGQKDSIAFSDLHCGNIKMKVLYSGLTTY